MKIPKSVKVGGLVYDIIVNHDVNHESNSWGSIHQQTQRIFIEGGLSSQKNGEVLLHELIHACLYHSGYSSNLPEADEEKIVHALTPSLYQVLKDNKLRFYD